MQAAASGSPGRADRIDADPGHLLVVAADGDDVVGALQLSFVPGLSRGGALRGQLEGVRVRADRRGSGLGGGLLWWAVTECRRHGCALVQLTTDRSRAEAHRFYEGLGFRHRTPATSCRCERPARTRPGRLRSPTLGAVSGQQIDPGVIELAGRVFDLARGGHTDELAAYVDAGVPANLTNDKGDTLLILAAYHGHPETVAALLARGADHARANDRGQTALAAAVFKQSAEAVQALLRAGADPDAGGPSAREMARFFDLPAMAALLDGAA
ncbi:GNAT family N-acetyltransferase [Blastococcus saxobsidens]|uniref:GNAT family N-acetyltransferase n=1 Tax=Blastococcus saxobsidens TaxID=138336 RepID=UPI0013154D60|nr:GNAT family N-acetyltransferase [Blastococcus saxobsidens]